MAQVDAAVASASGKGSEIAQYAQQYVGYPYVYGGSSPSGFDCSGFVTYVCKHFGYSVNRTASAQMDNGTAVSKSQLQPGDLVFFNNGNSRKRATHVPASTSAGTSLSTPPPPPWASSSATWTPPITAPGSWARAAWPEVRSGAQLQSYQDSGRATGSAAVLMQQ